MQASGGLAVPLSLPSLLNAATLAQYQVVMFLDNQPSAAQHPAFQAWMDKGGAFLGFHVCAFNTSSSSWDWYYNQLLGCGSFRTNTWGPTSAVFKVEDTVHAATERLPAKFTSAVSEWDGWTLTRRSPAGLSVSIHDLQGRALGAKANP